MSVAHPTDRKSTDLPASPTRANADRAAQPVQRNLRLPRGGLIGRTHDIAAAQALLLRDEVGLLTLSGPGGVGKTRLALQVASTLLDHFVDGVYVVSLAPLTDPELVLTSIAQTLGLRQRGAPSLLEGLQGYLHEKQLLLVLDNFEHLLAAAPAVGTLLSACSRLKVLATSRAALHLYGEQEYPVPPLAQSAAVALFVQRGQAVQPGFALSASNAAAVAEICLRLDGLPLALELAAAKLRLFAPAALLAQLERRLGLLTGGAQDAPARQRSLRDEIAWSYELLSQEEQRLFRRLAVFVGGFTLEAAHAVGLEEGAAGGDVLSGITALLDHNLVRSLLGTGGVGADADAEARFGMLETIREFALERLEASGEAESSRRRHADFFLALAEAIVPTLHAANQGAGHAQLTVEHDNLRAALTWSMQSAGSVDMALRLANALNDFWLLGGYWREGRRWSEATLALTTTAERTAARAALLVNTGALAVMQGDCIPARAWLEQGLEIARELGPNLTVGQAYTRLGFIANSQHDYAQARAYFEQSLALARELGDRYEMASQLIFLGNSARTEQDYDRAQALYEEGIALFQQLGAQWDVADSLTYVAMLSQLQGDDARAWTIYQECLACWRDLGTLQWKGIADCFDGLASICADRRQFEAAARLFGAAEEMRALMRGTPAQQASDPAAAKLPALRAGLGEAAFAAAWAEGRALSGAQAIAYALALPAPPAADEPPTAPPMPYPAGLTGREVEVLRLLAQGLTYAQIAEKLIISRRTVNAHLTAIYSKLGVSGREAATRFAIDHRLV